MSPGKSSSTCPWGNALSELLGKRDDDALRAADVTEPVHVLILGYFAYELSAMGAQAREDILGLDLSTARVAPLFLDCWVIVVGLARVRTNDKPSSA